MRNLKLFKLGKLDFGPIDLKGKRKEARPFSPNCAIHLTLKAKLNVFDPSDTYAPAIIENYAKKNNVTIYDRSLNWNHTHLLAKAPNKKAFDSFVRSVTANLARKHKVKGLFPDRPFTRLVKWGKAFQNAKKYIALNQLETLGVEKEEGREFLKTLCKF